MKRKIAIIGGGIAGLTFARCLSEKDYEIHIFEKKTRIWRSRRRHQCLSQCLMRNGRNRVARCHYLVRVHSLEQAF